MLGGKHGVAGQTLRDRDYEIARAAAQKDVAGAEQEFGVQRGAARDVRRSALCSVLGADSAVDHQRAARRDVNVAAPDQRLCGCDSRAHARSTAVHVAGADDRHVAAVRLRDAGGREVLRGSQHDVAAACVDRLKRGERVGVSERDAAVRKRGERRSSERAKCAFAMNAAGVQRRRGAQRRRGVERLVARRADGAAVDLRGGVERDRRQPAGQAIALGGIEHDQAGAAGRKAGAAVDRLLERRRAGADHRQRSARAQPKTHR